MHLDKGLNLVHTNETPLLKSGLQLPRMISQTILISDQFFGLGMTMKNRQVAFSSQRLELKGFASLNAQLPPLNRRPDLLKQPNQAQRCLNFCLHPSATSRQAGRVTLLLGVQAPRPFVPTPDQRMTNRPYGHRRDLQSKQGIKVTWTATRSRHPTFFQQQSSRTPARLTDALHAQSAGRARYGRIMTLGSLTYAVAMCARRATLQRRGTRQMPSR